MMKLATLSVLLLSSAAPASAQIVFDDTAPKAKSGEKDLDKVICRVEEVVGSRLNKKKVCATAREWKQMQEDNRNGLEEHQRLSQGPRSG